MPELEIGKGQMKVLRILWDKKRATVQEIIDILNETERVKPTTVWTFLKVLVKKGIVGYDVEKRTYIYYPLVEEPCVANHAVKNLINHMFSGSRESFATFIIKNRYISPEEVEQIKNLLNKRKE
ncbi:MAG: BlaI/MecI/CopY family transcriptional regulator [Candidatus Latescibacteria bacterium]|nr:BlaI/MecI/CopY family transcriptional regulator [Candidatus Latescibacterota bacterium]